MRVHRLNLAVMIVATLFVAATSSYGEFLDERVVVDFDGREWIAASCYADREQGLVEYILRGEDIENWTELVSTMSFPVYRSPGVVEFARDHHRDNAIKTCPEGIWKVLFTSDSLIICSWNPENCKAQAKPEYMLFGFIVGRQFVHSFWYSAKDRKTFGTNMLKWMDIFKHARVFAPDESLGGAPLGLLSDTAKMVKITYRYVSPHIEINSVKAQPTTIWRAGEKYARAEEPPNPATNVHKLTVMNEPNMWLINLFDKIGRHSLDPGPTFNTVCPVFNEWKDDGLKPLEFGREQAFFAYHGARRLADQLVDGVWCEAYELPRYYWLLHLYINKKTGLLYEVTRKGPDGSWVTVVYDDYQSGLGFDYSLFLPPENIKITER